MTDERRAERQAQIESRRAEAAAAYPSQWVKVTGEWRQTGDDRAWLVYAANYLFRTGGVRWALDPLSLRQRLPGAPAVDLSPLSGLSFVLLTHRHADHLDYTLIRTLRQHPIRWVIPEAILSLVLERCGLPESQVIIPRPLETLQIEGMRITPFEGLHWEPPAAEGARRAVWRRWATWWSGLESAGCSPAMCGTLICKSCRTLAGWRVLSPTCGWGGVGHCWSSHHCCRRSALSTPGRPPAVW